MPFNVELATAEAIADSLPDDTTRRLSGKDPIEAQKEYKQLQAKRPLPATHPAPPTMIDVRDAIVPADREAKAVATMVDAIAQKQYLPALSSQVPIRFVPLDKVAGVFLHRKGRPVAIHVSTTAKTPHLTTAHESGHLLDLLVGGGVFASENSPLLAPWRVAVEQSDSYRFLRSIAADVADAEAKRHITYLLRWRELFARCYAQWIARSATQAAQDELAQRVFDHWSAEEFGPIEIAFVAFLREKGLLK